jgi:hypothetical protein
VSITIKLQGGLGNQLFIYAFGKALMLHTGLDIKFDITEYQGEYRQYELNHFNTNAITVKFKRKKNIFKKIIKECLIIKSLKNKINVYDEFPRYKTLNTHNGFEYDEEFKNIQNGNYIKGFIQNEKYFLDIANEIRQNFKLITPLDEKNKKIIEDIKNTESISLHIRRGDYLTIAKDYGSCSIEYYQKALEIIKEKINAENLKAFIFTDDPEWVKENIKFDIDTYYVENNLGKGYFDLELMKNCKHNIIANSSFSWWGAWLNENPNKIVIAPKPWLASVENDYELIPKSWIRIEEFNSLSQMPSRVERVIPLKVVKIIHNNKLKKVA